MRERSWGCRAAPWILAWVSLYQDSSERQVRVGALAHARTFGRVEDFRRASGRPFGREGLLLTCKRSSLRKVRRFLACKWSSLRKGRPSAHVQEVVPSEGSKIFGVQMVVPSEGSTFCSRASGRPFGRFDLLLTCKWSSFRKVRRFSACKWSSLRKVRPSAHVQVVVPSEGSTFCSRASGRPFGRFDLLHMCAIQLFPLPTAPFEFKDLNSVELGWPSSSEGLPEALVLRLPQRVYQEGVSVARNGRKGAIWPVLAVCAPHFGAKGRISPLRAKFWRVT